MPHWILVWDFVVRVQSLNELWGAWCEAVLMNRPRAAIFDIDGVLKFRGEVCAGAIETIAALRDGGAILRFLTNSIQGAK